MDNAGFDLYVVFLSNKVLINEWFYQQRLKISSEME